jgi:hypothetical protein
VLVLNSIRLKSSVVGPAGGLLNIDSIPPASRLKNEFVLELVDIFKAYTQCDILMQNKRENNINQRRI